MPEIQDDKSAYVIPFILENLKSFQQKSSTDQPFFIGLNGVQGAGKSVLVSILYTTLVSEPYNLPTVVFSLDDLYLTHTDQVALANSHADNPLLQHRGQPGTHDVALARQVLTSLKEGRPTRIPQYNKAAFQGQGDRVPEMAWTTVNDNNDQEEKGSPKQKIKVVLFEGWCVGFRALPDEELDKRHDEAIQAARASGSTYAGRLGHNTLHSVREINNFLKQYDTINDQLDAFVHLDAADPLYVYQWRLQQEQALRTQKGSGMTDMQVHAFVDGYYPAYELYTENLRRGIFMQDGDVADAQVPRRKQIRLVVDANRQVTNVITI